MPQVQVIQPIQQQPKRLRVAAYARVSTKSNEQLHSMSVQTEYYEDLIQKNPNWEFVGVYADEGISGTSIKHRAELNRLMEDCRAGMIDRILVKSASRMARNTVDLLTLVRELKSIGVTVQFEKEQFDTDSATGEMMLSMMCAIAQEESLSISKNMKWGIRKKMQAGTYVNCATPFGYRQQDHQLVLEKNEAAVVRLVFEKYLSGVGIAEIARYLNENHPKEGGWWYTSAVRFMLHNEAYKGDTLHQKHYTTDTLPFMVYHNEGQFPKYCAYKSHVAIVSDEDFDKVQQLLKTKQMSVPNAAPRVFTKKIYCAECGTVFAQASRANGAVAWGCRKHLNKSSLCPVKSVYETELCRAFLYKKNTGQLPQYYIENYHEGIVSKQMFREVQAEIARRNSKSAANQRKRRRGRYNSKYALSERLFCGDCGSPYKRVTWNIHGRKQIVWRCVNRIEYGTKFCGSSPSIPEEKLHRAILKAVQDLAANFTDEVAAQINGILHSIQTGESIKPNLQEQLEQTQQEFDRLLEMSLDFDEDTPFLDDRLKKLNSKIKRLKKAIEETAAQQEKASQPELLLSARDLQIQEYSGRW